MSYLDKLTRCGIEAHLSETEKRKIYILNNWNIIAATVQIPYTVAALLFEDFISAALNMVYVLVSVFSYLLTYQNRHSAARYIIIIFFPILLILTAGMFGNDSQILTIFGIMALSVPFFFDSKKENILLGIYVAASALAGYWWGLSPFMELAQQPAVQLVFSIINLLVSVLVIIVFVRILNAENLRFQASILAKNEELTTQKEEIETQRDRLTEMNQEVSNQNNALVRSNRIIERKNKTITDSIRYAQRIQTAMMPPVEELRQHFPENFLIYRPKDIIGGDFYWEEATEHGVFLAVADCTGHGVPGALMSMLGANLLSQIVLRGIYTPSEILEELDRQVRKQLRQDEASSDVRDGMDITLCRIASDSVQIASAQRAVLLKYASGTWEHLKGDKNPIGSGVYASKKFTVHTFSRVEIHSLYAYTDGCTDMFDAQNTQKLGRKRWEAWLQETASVTAAMQGKEIEQRLKTWAGTTPPIDDLLALHIRL